METRRTSNADRVYPITAFPGFRPGSELTVRLSKNRFLVPDVAVQRKDQIQDPYPTEPIHLCIEILSPDDRMSEMIAKGEEYLGWGVPMVWIIDPVNQVAWEFSLNRPLHEVPPNGSLTEYTTMALPAINANDVISLTLSAESDYLPTATCTYVAADLTGSGGWKNNGNPSVLPGACTP